MKPYQNEASQSKRAEMLKHDSFNSRGDSFNSRAIADALAQAGRFAAENRATVIGSEAVEYPRLPAESPWACDMVGLEPPLGFSVDAMEPCGEAHELAAGKSAEGGVALHPLLPAPPNADAMKRRKL